LVNGAALASDAIAVATALARRAELTAVLTDMRCLRSILVSCPDWTRRQYASRGTVVTGAPLARRLFFMGGKLFRHAIALIRTGKAPPRKTQGFYITTILEPPQLEGVPLKCDQGGRSRTGML
jgi:hypothetical protein